MIAANIRENARFCASYGSPFTASLLDAIADDVEAGGPCAALSAGFTGSSRGDVLGLRFAGALHFAGLNGKDRDLAAEYPSARAEWSMERVWPRARAFFEREPEWTRAFIATPPQTNETRRALALAAGFLTAADLWRRPFDIYEIGASAGLNLLWDKFRYDTDAWRWGDPGSRVRLQSRWSAPAPPVFAPVKVEGRYACDLNPLDVRDAGEALRLRAYVWADQTERLARFDAAVALARDAGVAVDRADAAEWLEAKLSARDPTKPAVVYHSVFLQYPPPATRTRIIDLIGAAGASASEEAPFAWMRLEPTDLVSHDTPGYTTEITLWPGGENLVLLSTDGHVREVFAPGCAPVSNRPSRTPRRACASRIG